MFHNENNFDHKYITRCHEIFTPNIVLLNYRIRNSSGPLIDMLNLSEYVFDFAEIFASKVRIFAQSNNSAKSESYEKYLRISKSKIKGLRWVGNVINRGTKILWHCLLFYLKRGNDMTLFALQNPLYNVIQLNWLNVK